MLPEFRDFGNLSLESPGKDSWGSDALFGDFSSTD